MSRNHGQWSTIINVFHSWLFIIEHKISDDCIRFTTADATT